MVPVTVRSMAGKLLHLSVEDDAEVLQLKELLAESWGVPVICQRLLLGTAVLEDSATLASLCNDGNPLDVTMIACLDGVHLALEMGTRPQQVCALAALTELGRETRSRVCEQAIARVDAGIPFWYPDMRCAALEMLQGDPRVLSAVYSRLEDRVASVRRAAVEAMPLLTDGSNPLAVAAVYGRLLDRAACVRAAAVHALPRLCDVGDERALTALSSCLEDRAATVQEAAAGALAEVARRRVLQTEDCKTTDGVAAAKEEPVGGWPAARPAASRRFRTRRCRRVP